MSSLAASRAIWAIRMRSPLSWPNGERVDNDPYLRTHFFGIGAGQRRGIGGGYAGDAVALRPCMMEGTNGTGVPNGSRSM